MFSKNGILYDEFDKLFESLFEDAQIYKEIIRSVAKNDTACPCRI